MTIAIGASCAHGMIVAADTNIILSDGSKKQGCKVEAVLANGGAFAIANASNDGNAAVTLSRHILADLKSVDTFSTLEEVETIVTARMTQWANAFQEPPSTQLILTAVIGSGHFPNPEGAALYFCEPPNTMRSISLLDEGYVGIGTGATFTDPLQKMFFRTTIKSVPNRLHEIAYLMYRAKQDSAMCGGHTTTVVLAFDRYTQPIWVNQLSMQAAENMGPKLDFLLSGTAMAVTQSDAAVRKFVKDFGRTIVALGTSFRQHKFFGVDGKEVT